MWWKSLVMPGLFHAVVVNDVCSMSDIKGAMTLYISRRCAQIYAPYPTAGAMSQMVGIRPRLFHRPCQMSIFQAPLP